MTRLVPENGNATIDANTETGCPATVNKNVFTAGDPNPATYKTLQTHDETFTFTIDYDLRSDLNAFENYTRAILVDKIHYDGFHDLFDVLEVYAINYDENGKMQKYVASTSALSRFTVEPGGDAASLEEAKLYPISNNTGENPYTFKTGNLVFRDAKINSVDLIKHYNLLVRDGRYDYAFYLPIYPWTSPYPENQNQGVWNFTNHKIRVVIEAKLKDGVNFADSDLETILYITNEARLIKTYERNNDFRIVPPEGITNFLLDDVEPYEGRVDMANIIFPSLEDPVVDKTVHPLATDRLDLSPAKDLRLDSAAREFEYHFSIDFPENMYHIDNLRIIDAFSELHRPIRKADIDFYIVDPALLPEPENPEEPVTVPLTEPNANDLFLNKSSDTEEPEVGASGFVMERDPDNPDYNVAFRGVNLQAANAATQRLAGKKLVIRLKTGLRDDDNADYTANVANDPETERPFLKIKNNARISFNNTLSETLDTRVRLETRVLKMKKTDAATGEPLSGAEFRITDKSVDNNPSKIIVEDPDETGLYRFPYMIPGRHYEISEETAPRGYQKSGDVWLVEVKPSGRFEVKLQSDQSEITDADGFYVFTNAKHLNPTIKKYIGRLDDAIMLDGAEPAHRTESEAMRLGASDEPVVYTVHVLMPETASGIFELKVTDEMHANMTFVDASVTEDSFDVAIIEVNPDNPRERTLIRKLNRDDHFILNQPRRELVITEPGVLKDLDGAGRALEVRIVVRSSRGMESLVDNNAGSNIVKNEAVVRVNEESDNPIRSNPVYFSFVRGKVNLQKQIQPRVENGYGEPVDMPANLAATFDLYRTDESGNAEIVRTGLRTNTVDPENPEGSEANPGMLEVDYLEPGDYYLVETQSPVNHDLNTERIPFSIPENTTGPVEPVTELTLEPFVNKETRKLYLHKVVGPPVPPASHDSATYPHGQSYALENIDEEFSYIFTVTIPEDYEYPLLLVDDEPVLVNLIKTGKPGSLQVYVGTQDAASEGVFFNYEPDGELKREVNFFEGRLSLALPVETSDGQKRNRYAGKAVRITLNARILREEYFKADLASVLVGGALRNTVRVYAGTENSPPDVNGEPVAKAVADILVPTYRPVSFKKIKGDLAKTPLPEAYFTISRVKGDIVEEEGPNYGSYELDETFAPLTAKSDADGIVRFPHLQTGLYILEEAARPGYLPFEKHVIQVYRDPNRPAEVTPLKQKDFVPIDTYDFINMEEFGIFGLKQWQFSTEEVTVPEDIRNQFVAKLIPDTLELQLVRRVKGTPPENNVPVGEPYVADRLHNFQFAFPQQPKFNAEGEEYVYEVVETDPIPGFTLLQSPDDYNITNQLNLHSFVFRKVEGDDIDGDPVPGVTFRLRQLGAEDPGKALIFEAVSEADGTVRFDTLIPGRYQLSEIWDNVSDVYIEADLTTEIEVGPDGKITNLSPDIGHLSHDEASQRFYVSNYKQPAPLKTVKDPRTGAYVRENVIDNFDDTIHYRIVLPALRTEDVHLIEIRDTLAPGMMLPWAAAVKDDFRCYFADPRAGHENASIRIIDYNYAVRRVLEDGSREVMIVLTENARGIDRDNQIVTDLPSLMDGQDLILEFASRMTLSREEFLQRYAAADHTIENTAVLRLNNLDSNMTAVAQPTRTTVGISEFKFKKTLEKPLGQAAPELRFFEFRMYRLFEDGNERLYGATDRATRLEDNLYEIRFDNLDAGTYRIVEITPPFGYVPMDDLLVRLSFDAAGAPIWELRDAEGEWKEYVYDPNTTEPVINLLPAASEVRKEAMGVDSPVAEAIRELRENDTLSPDSDVLLDLEATSGIYKMDSREEFFDYRIGIKIPEDITGIHELVVEDDLPAMFRIVGINDTYSESKIRELDAFYSELEDPGNVAGDDEAAIAAAQAAAREALKRFDYRVFLTKPLATDEGTITGHNVLYNEIYDFNMPISDPIVESFEFHNYLDLVRNKDRTVSNYAIRYTINKPEIINYLAGGTLNIVFRVYLGPNYRDMQDYTDFYPDKRLRNTVDILVNGRHNNSSEHFTIPTDKYGLKLQKVALLEAVEGTGMFIYDNRRTYPAYDAIFTIRHAEAPQEEVLYTLTSDDHGWIEFPAKLDAGTYIIEEKHLPAGYIAYEDNTLDGAKQRVPSEFCQSADYYELTVDPEAEDGNLFRLIAYKNNPADPNAPLTEELKWLNREEPEDEEKPPVDIPDFILTNEPMTKLQVNKLWDDKDNELRLRPDTISVKLERYTGGTVNEDGELVGGTRDPDFDPDPLTIARGRFPILIRPENVKQDGRPVSLLRFDRKGREYVYVVKEISASDSSPTTTYYRLDKPKALVLDSVSGELSAELTNRLRTQDFSLRKVYRDGEGNDAVLPNTVFSINYKRRVDDGEHVTISRELTTDANGLIHIDYLAPNLRYALYEASAPSGFVKDDKLYVIVTDKDGVPYLYSADNQNVRLPRHDALTFEPSDYSPGLLTYHPAVDATADNEQEIYRKLEDGTYQVRMENKLATDPEAGKTVQGKREHNYQEEPQLDYEVIFSIYDVAGQNQLILQDILDNPGLKILPETIVLKDNNDHELYPDNVHHGATLEVTPTSRTRRRTIRQRRSGKCSLRSARKTKTAIFRSSPIAS